MLRTAPPALPQCAPSQIACYGMLLPAAACSKCGTKVYPPEAMKIHIEWHDHPERRYLVDSKGDRRVARQWEARSYG